MKFSSTSIILHRTWYSCETVGFAGSLAHDIMIWKQLEWDLYTRT